MADEKKFYGSTEYLGKPPVPGWVDKKYKGQENRRKQFIIAIMDESKKKGQPMSWGQASRELDRQIRISQKEILWQEHRKTLTESSPPREGPREGPAFKQRITKEPYRPPPDEKAQLMAENADLREQINALKDSFRVLNQEFSQYRKDHP